VEDEQQEGLKVSNIPQKDDASEEVIVENSKMVMPDLVEDNIHDAGDGRRIGKNSGRGYVVSSRTQMFICQLGQRSENTDCTYARCKGCFVEPSNGEEVLENVMPPKL
jgi:hypothetical protein